MSVELVRMTPEFLDAILAGRRPEAERLLGIRIPAAWPDEDDARFLRFRRRQMAKRPEFVEWLVRAVVVDGEMIGHAGYHGPPGINEKQDPGAVEMGYTIFEPYRGRGHATEAVVALMDEARGRGIERFVLSISPENAASLRIAEKLGFVETGSHWDDEDGLELEFELDRGNPARTDVSEIPPP